MRLRFAERQAELQAEINRFNAQLSTGPRTPYGKAKSSLNAVKTGLTGRTVLLHDDDAEAYRQHVAAYQNEYQPVGLREGELVQSLADTQWRLARIPCLEIAIYTRGRCEFAGTLEDQAPELCASMIELETYLKYEKQLRNLQLQESRLARRFEKEKTELQQLQKERKAEEQKQAKQQPTTAAGPAHAPSNGTAAHATAEAGFVFSNGETTEDVVSAELIQTAA